MPERSIPESPTPDQGATDSQITAAQAAGDQAGADTTTATPANDATACDPPGLSGSTATASHPPSTASDPPVDSATGSGAQSTAVLTKTSASADPTPGAPSPSASEPVPITTLIAAQHTSVPIEPETAVRQAAAGTIPPPSPMPPPPIPANVPQRWRRVARPPGVLPAAALAGIVGATVIPVDRPGIGWLLTGAAITGALCVVDYRARSRGTGERDSPESTTASDASQTTLPATSAPTTANASAAQTPAQVADSTSESAAVPLSTTNPTAAVVDGPTTIPSAGADRGDGTTANTETSERSVSESGRPTKAVAAQEPALHDRVWWTVAALVLLGVGTFRAAGWLFALCVIAACVAGSLAVLGRRTARGIVHDMFAVPLASFGAVPWAFSGLRESQPTEMSAVRRYGVSVAATAALLVVFVPLLGGADATFAGLLSGLVPTVDAAAAWQWILLFVVVAIGALGALYLLAGPPARAADSGRPVRLWSRSEWMLPVGALTVLFAVFVGAQFVALFGGDDYVQRTAGLTYAEYARSGFWQLSAVSILTLAVILAVLHWSVQQTAADRLSLRILLGAVSVLTLVIVCSALGRMWTYQQAYGFTVLRLLVTMCELWVGVVYVLVLIAIARLRWSWVPRAAIATALGTLIVLAVLNPEHLVAERNIDRWQTSGRLDEDYLSRLSPDILPALEPLPTYLRIEIETPILDDLDNDPWWSWNLSRSSAR